MRTLHLIFLSVIIGFFFSCQNEDEVNPDTGSVPSASGGGAMLPINEGAVNEQPIGGFVDEGNFAEPGGETLSGESDINTSFPEGDNENGINMPQSSDISSDDQVSFNQINSSEGNQVDHELTADKPVNAEEEDSGVTETAKEQEYPFTYEGSASGIAFFKKENRKGIFFSAPAKISAKAEPAYLKNLIKKGVKPSEISFVLLPESLVKSAGASLGNLAVVYNPLSGKQSSAVIAGFSSRPQVSAGVADNLISDINHKQSLTILIFPDSHSNYAWSREEIEKTAGKRLSNWGSLKETNEHFKSPVL